MKQMILSALLLLVSLSSAAQNAKNDSIQEKFFKAKVRELVYRLDITDAQKPQFVAVYRRYNDEMRAAWGTPRPPKKKETTQEADKKKQDKPRTSTDVANAQKRKIERLQRAQNVQMKYLDELAKVLDAKQLSKFYEVEGKIQKKLMERKKSANRGKSVNRGKTVNRGRTAPSVHRPRPKNP